MFGHLSESPSGNGVPGYYDVPFQRKEGDGVGRLALDGIGGKNLVLRPLLIFRKCPTLHTASFNGNVVGGIHQNPTSFVHFLFQMDARPKRTANFQESLPSRNSRRSSFSCQELFLKNCEGHEVEAPTRVDMADITGRITEEEHFRNE
jgi:hypothetical protein